MAEVATEEERESMLVSELTSVGSLYATPAPCITIAS